MQIGIIMPSCVTAIGRVPFAGALHYHPELHMASLELGLHKNVCPMSHSAAVMLLWSRPTFHALLPAFKASVPAALRVEMPVAKHHHLSGSMSFLTLPG